MVYDGKLKTEQYWSGLLGSTGAARSVSDIFSGEGEEISSSNARTDCISIC